MATLKSNNELKNSQTFHTSPIISDRERIGEYMTRGAIPRLLFKCFIFDVNIPKTDIINSHSQLYHNWENDFQRGLYYY